MEGDSKSRFAVTEILGALAVILSLIFVGVQIRENNRATMSATASASIDTASAWYYEVGNNEQSSALLYQYLTNPDSLTDEERFQATMNLHGLFLLFQNSYYLANDGTLEQTILHTLTEVVVGIKDLPGFHLFWKQRKSVFSEGFQDYVNSIIASERTVSEGLFDGTGSIPSSNK